jgi:hypothetical protein
MKAELFTAEWVCFGAYVASMTEKGVIFPDLAPSNVGVDEDSQRIVIFDTDCFDEYPFPGDLHVYATALFSLVAYIPVHFAAAFRFGYVHHGGRFGRLVFDRLRHEHGLTPWADSAQVPVISRLEDSGWVEEHRGWMRRRQDLDLPDLEEGAWLFLSLLRPDESTALGEELRRRDPELAFYAFERQLIVNLARNDLRAFLLAITEIGRLAAEHGDRLRAQVWGMTLTALARVPNTATGSAWADLAFWLPWTAEEQARALGAVQ